MLNILLFSSDWFISPISRFDLFKEGICKALEDSSRIVEQARCNMDELADQANLIVQVRTRNSIAFLGLT